MENPASDLNKAPKPQFTSRYADPSHPASSGSLMGLVTGGHVTGDRLISMRGRYDQGLGGVLLGRRQGPIAQVVGGMQATRANSGNGHSRPKDRHSPSPGRYAPGSRNPRDRLLGPVGGARGGAVGGIQKMLKSVSLHQHQGVILVY